MVSSRYKKLEIVVFACGAVVMILEIVGSRVLAPYIGTSVYIWTSLIGIVMGSLSLGYYYGGRYADKKADFAGLSQIILIASISILLMNVCKEFVLFYLTKFILDPKISSLVIGFILFFIPSFLLGMVSPYAVKLQLKNLEHSAAEIGRLYAISTFGSIFGTFISGYFLIAYLGTTNILYFLSGVLALLALYCGNKKSLILFILLMEMLFGIPKNPKFVDIDTNYNRVWIVDSKNDAGVVTRNMLLNKQNASAVNLDNSTQILFDYYKFYDLYKHRQGSIKNALILGGAGYSYPRIFSMNNPDVKLDVVEIDPALISLANKYFDYKPSSYTNVIHEDARTFLNLNSTKYDLIFVDVFDSYYSVPTHLTTVEAVSKLRFSLSSNGVVFTNLISALEGKNSAFLKSAVATQKKVFDQVLVFQVNNRALDEMQNVVLVSFNDFSDKEIFVKNLPHSIDLNTTESLVLTDDYSPVERYFFHVI